VKLIDSDAKSAVDVYKKLMVNCYGNKDENEKKGDSNVRERPKSALVSNECLVNPEATIYGNGRVEVLDYGVFDVNKIPVRVLFNDEQFSVWMKVLFKEDVENPIFAFTIKDLKGMEITGTNSLYEDAASIRYLNGETVVIEFTQRMNMASGQYLLSLGCTGFQGDQFVVYQRLYDILCFEVISYKKFVGFYDMKSDIRIEKYRG
jgi:teichoic acid transport system ATP-binding protein